ncbi:MAG: hypothetical protein LJE84_09040 [Gammaproteobacteria bacterium]|jgi:hypothetical protein|nr:hypothetical protein [Gammaproteobacteria bacterium]
MSNSTLHATTAELDRLRAGLPVDARTGTHVDGCPLCQTAMGRWHQRAAAIREVPLSAGQRNRLRAARLQALDGAPRQRPSRWRLVAASAGVFGVALAFGLWLAPQSTLAPMDAHADIYTDSDFYLWLENREQNPGS